MDHCERYQDLCSAALDNALTAQEKEALDAHLAVCPSCCVYLEDLQQMCTLWKEMEIPVPKELHEKMMGAIEAEVQKTIVQTPQKQHRRPPVFTMLAAAAACVMLAVSGQLTGLLGQISASPLQVTARKEVLSTADAMIPQSKLQDATAESEVRTEQPERKQQESELKSESQSEIVKEKIVQEEAGKTKKSKALKEMQLNQPENQRKLKDVGKIQSEDVSQVIEEEPMVRESEAPEQKLMGRMAEPQSAVTHAASGGLPEELGQMQFARCYDVTGGAELPVLDDMKLLVTADGVSYYSVENNESKIEQIQQALKKSGYILTLNEASGASIQRSAKTILLIVRTA